MRRLLFLILPCLLLLFGIGPVYADPWPSDTPPTISTSLPDILQTLLFESGEVDLSTLGVSDTELLGVGPQLDPPSSSDDDVLIVDDDGLDCPNFQYNTIQAAVTAAGAGDKIKVCQGTYVEQVTIPAGKDGLTLFAAAALQAVIKAPTVMMDEKAIVHVNGAHGVTIRGFTITGPGGGSCDSIRYGVLVDDGGSALITNNHITEIHDIPLFPNTTVSGCQNGFGVGVGRRFAEGNSGTATVLHNLIDKYQKTGVLVNGVDVMSGVPSSAEVAYNEVVGIGPTSDNGQNGIQVTRGAHGDVHHNRVSQNFYSPTDVEATGILVSAFFLANPVARVHHNDVFTNENGIALFDADSSEVSYNNSRNNAYGIHAYELTSGNLIAYNKAFENSTFDCSDETPMTPNDWVKDLGRTENQTGLCKQAGPQ